MIDSPLAAVRTVSTRPLLYFSKIAVLTFLPFCALAETEPWKRGAFEIRVFDVEQGDSQLVIFPSGFSILIDAWEPSWNSNKGASRVAQRIRDITGGTHVNVGMLSHLHLDHIGYANKGGFWSLIEEEGITFDVFIDRDAGVWEDADGDGTCDHESEIVWHNAGTQGGTSRRWLCYATDPNSSIFDIRQVAEVGSTTQIYPPDDDARVEIIQADGKDVLMENGVTSITGDHTGDSLPPSENDYSIALKISFGEIDYATAGDAGGDYDVSSRGYTYNDVETVIADDFGQVEVLRANHHGSGHSTNAKYLDTLNPSVILISCGQNGYGHPAQDVLDRSLRNGDVYVTNLCDEDRDYQDIHVVDGDIILRSTDGVNYTVNGKSYVARRRDLKGVVVNEVVPNPSAGELEWVELHNTSSKNIELSGAWIDDKPGGRAPVRIPSGSTILAGGYWTLDTNRIFNDDGDEVRFMNSDGTTVVDSFQYTKSAKGQSWRRPPDGGNWQTSPTSNTTKGKANR